MHVFACVDYSDFLIILQSPLFDGNVTSIDIGSTTNTGHNPDMVSVCVCFMCVDYSEFLNFFLQSPISDSDLLSSDSDGDISDIVSVCVCVYICRHSL